MKEYLREVVLQESRVIGSQVRFLPHRIPSTHSHTHRLSCGFKSLRQKDWTTRSQSLGQLLLLLLLLLLLVPVVATNSTHVDECNSNYASKGQQFSPLFPDTWGDWVMESLGDELEGPFWRIERVSLCVTFWCLFPHLLKFARWSAAGFCGWWWSLCRQSFYRQLVFKESGKSDQYKCYNRAAAKRASLTR